MIGRSERQLCGNVCRRFGSGLSGAVVHHIDQMPFLNFSQNIRHAGQSLSIDLKTTRQRTPNYVQCG
jgi:hypothetical protein